MSEEPLSIKIHRTPRGEHVWLINKADGTEVANGWVGASLGLELAEAIAAQVQSMVEKKRRQQMASRKEAEAQE